MRIGPEMKAALNSLKHEEKWEQGEHILISGGTGSGKTTLARPIAELRAERRGGTHLVFVCKPSRDDTLARDYKDYTRWKSWKKSPGPTDSRVLLWPPVEKAKSIREVIDIQKEVFSEALDQLSKIGKWTIQIDDALYFTDRKYLGFDVELGMLHAMARSSKLTILTLTQRPAFIPVIIYDSVTHAFVSQTSEFTDATRLSNLGGKTSSRDRLRTLSELPRFDYLWISKRSFRDDRIINAGR